MCFPVNIIKCLRAAFLYNTSGGMFLSILVSARSSVQIAEKTRFISRLLIRYLKIFYEDLHISNDNNP